MSSILALENPTIERSHNGLQSTESHKSDMTEQAMQEK